jgi:hypothetical protein
MVKIPGDADSRRRCAMDGFERVESSDWRGKIVLGFRKIQSNYSQRKYGKNALVVDDGGDGDILWRCFSWRTMCEGRFEWILEREERNNWQWAMAVWIQEDTERDYSQRVYGKNVLVICNEMMVKILRRR